MNIEKFIELLDRINKIETISQICDMLVEVDTIRTLDKEEQKIIDECLTEAVDVAITSERFKTYFSQRYEENNVCSVFADATPETVLINGVPMEIYTSSKQG